VDVNVFDGVEFMGDGLVVDLLWVWLFVIVFGIDVFYVIGFLVVI